MGSPASLPAFQIDGTTLGWGQPVYCVAELSANHNQSIEEAVALIRAAKECGADAVKIQTYTPDTMTIDCSREEFWIGQGTLWEGQNLYQLYKEAQTPYEWHPRLQEVARNECITLFSTPFDVSSVDFLEFLDMPAYKVASFELVDVPLLKRVAATGKPLILSTGMASLAEIEEAVTTVRQAGAKGLVLLKTNSAYPAPPDEMNLVTIPHLAQAFHVPVGLSDHSLGIAVPVAAAALGAVMVEKHLTRSRSVPGPDSEFSLEPDEFKAMVQAVRTARSALGEVSYEVTPKQLASRAFRRSLFAVADLEPGAQFTEENVRSIRPSNGLHPRHLPEVLGRKAARAIERGTPLSWDLIR